MKASVLLIAERDGALACCQFDADVSWNALDVGDSEMMATFFPHKIREVSIYELPHGKQLRWIPHDPTRWTFWDHIKAAFAAAYGGKR